MLAADVQPRSDRTGQNSAVRAKLIPTVRGSVFVFGTKISIHRH